MLCISIRKEKTDKIVPVEKKTFNLKELSENLKQKKVGRWKKNVLKRSLQMPA